MRVLLSTIGSRGDVQPLVALGRQLVALGQQVHLCVPPDFREWIERLGIGITHAPGTPTIDSLTNALQHALQPDVTARAQSIAPAIRTDGAWVASQRLLDTSVVRQP